MNCGYRAAFCCTPAFSLDLLGNNIDLCNSFSAAVQNKNFMAYLYAEITSDAYFLIYKCLHKELLHLSINNAINIPNLIKSKMQKNITNQN